MTPATPPASARHDFGGALVWIATGAIIVVLALRMERMEQQGGTVFTAPGLWPGIIGLLLALLGVALAVRSLARARAIGWDTAEVDDTELVTAARFALAIALFLAYALVLVGRGLPFWLGTAIFVTAFVYLFQREERRARGETLRGAAVALACGVFTALVVTLTFQELFYVRLP